MLEALSKSAFHTLARSVALKRLASRYGMPPDGGFARRFIAGETSTEAIAAARAIEAGRCRHARLPRRERGEPRRGGSGHARVRP